MFCKECQNKITNKSYFCPNCGNNLKLNKKRNTKLIMFISLIIISALIIALGYFCYTYFNKNKNDISKETKNYNTLEKIKSDYEKGNINVKDYFSQLVYLEFDSPKLDSKYLSDYEYYTTECELYTDEVLNNHYEKLDQDVIKFYLANKSMTNVVLGEKKASITKLPNNTTNLKAKQLEENKNNIINHRLENVYLTKEGHFLIWYTSRGDDAITEKQLKSLAEGLEDSITKYEQYFGIKYSYTPYVDNRYFNEDWKNAKETLKQNNISTSSLKTAMSVYVYDTGSQTVLASYNDENDVVKWLNRSLVLDILDQDGIVNYPYIVINKKGISNNINSLSQLYNHELFHHMQYLFCKSTTGKRCLADETLIEGMANFASAKVSDVSTTNNFLNNWAGIYTKNTSTKLSDIVDSKGSKGYALFPYFYSYSTQVNNWEKILMNAHNYKDAFNYIKNNTPKKNLVSTINDLAYYSISQNYDNKSLKSITGIRNKINLENNKKYNLTINAGSIDYFDLTKTPNLNILTKNNTYLTIKLYGYKEGIYKEIKASSNSMKLDTTFFANYDKFYLAVTNGDLTNSHNYTIDTKNNKQQNNNEYITSFNNYNIEIIINTKNNGVELEQHSKGTIDELHQKEYLETKTNTMGIKITNKIYYDFDTGYTYISQPFKEDYWLKEKGTSQIVDLGKILDKLISMEDVTKISNNHYKVKMTENDIKNLINFANSSSSTIKKDINIDVYTKNGYIVELKYDFTKLISGFEQFTTTIKFSNYNNAGNVEIPQTIINNAKNQ